MGDVYAILAIIGVYLVGAWVAALVCGFNSIGESLDELDLVVIFFWPLALVFWGIEIAACAVFDIVDAWSNMKFGKVVNRVLWWISLPLRPVAIGRMVRDWKTKMLSRRRKLEGEGK